MRRRSKRLLVVQCEEQFLNLYLSEELLTAQKRRGIVQIRKPPHEVGEAALSV